MIRLDAATVLLQWATGGLLFLWVTSRHRLVGIGYGWLLRSVYGVLAAGSVVAGQLTEPVAVRDACAALVAAAALVALTVSVVRRKAGVAGERALRERKAARVAAMLGPKASPGTDAAPAARLPATGAAGPAGATTTGPPGPPPGLSPGPATGAATGPPTDLYPAPTTTGTPGPPTGLGPGPTHGPTHGAAAGPTTDPAGGPTTDPAGGPTPGPAGATAAGPTAGPRGADAHHSAREFPPALDLVAPLVGLVGLVAAAAAAGGPSVLALVRILAGAAFLGAVSDAMLLGHWYLVQPGLGRQPLLELNRWLALAWPVEVAALLWPAGMLSVLSGSIDDGWGGTLGWFWVACAITTLVLTVVTKAALQERSYSAVMAATGLLYLAILMAFGTDLVARAVLAG